MRQSCPTITGVLQEERANRIFRRNFIAALGVSSAVLLLYGIYTLRTVELLVACAGFLAYFLAWPVDLLAKRWKRPAAVALIFTSFVLLLISLVVSFIPITFVQIQELSATMPDIIRRLEETLAGLSLQLPTGQEINLSQSLDSMLNQLQSSTPAVLGNVVNFTQSLVSGTASVAAALIVIPLITLYFLMDSSRLRAAFLGCFTARLQPDVDRALSAVNRSLGSYIYSRILLALFVAVGMTLVMAILGIRYALLLGLLCFFGEFIPVVGSWIAIAVIGLIALATDPVDLVWIIVFTIIIQMVQNYVLAPKLTGDAMNLHPLTVILAMLIGGTLGGIAGLVVAIPAAAALKVIFSIFVFRREEHGIPVPKLDLISAGADKADFQEHPQADV